MRNDIYLDDNERSSSVCAACPQVGTEPRRYTLIWMKSLVDTTGSSGAAPSKSTTPVSHSVPTSSHKEIYEGVPIPLLSKLYRGVTAPIRLLPDFLIIGTQRGGTTSLYRYLKAHPCIGTT